MARPREDEVRPSLIAAKKDWGDNPTVVISGYLAESDVVEIEGKVKRWRLYRTLNMDEFVEFAWDAVRHAEGIQLSPPPTGHTNPTDPLEPVTLWLDPSAKVTMGGFVVGDIAGLYSSHADLAANLGGPGAGQVLRFGRSGLGCSNNPGCGGTN